MTDADGLAALRQECEKKLWKAENDSAEDSFTTPAALEAIWPIIVSALERERQARAQAWQPMETAPKDGSDFIGTYKHGIYGWIRRPARWYFDKLHKDGGYFVMEGGGDPSLWQPLPPSPDASGGNL